MALRLIKEALDFMYVTLLPVHLLDLESQLFFSFTYRNFIKLLNTSEYRIWGDLKLLECVW